MAAGNRLRPAENLSQNYSLIKPLIILQYFKDPSIPPRHWRRLFSPN
jgi:hypothetical protein